MKRGSSLVFFRLMPNVVYCLQLSLACDKPSVAICIPFRSLSVCLCIGLIEVCLLVYWLDRYTSMSVFLCIGLTEVCHDCENKYIDLEMLSST